MAISPRAWSVNPHDTIVNVGWGANGYQINISVTSAYNEGEPQSRNVTLALTSGGLKVGGEILFQELINTDEFLIFNAEMFFAGVLGTDEPLFELNLSGAIAVVDTAQDPPLVEPFCGTSTVDSTSSGPYKVPNPFIPNGFQYFEDIVVTTSSPAGSGGAAWTNGPLAGGRELDLSQGSSFHAEAQTIWYRDAQGNWVDTGLSCDQLGQPGGPNLEATRVEGFGLGCQVFDFSRINFIGPHMTFGIEPVFIGLNSDFTPIFDQHPDGKYTFAAKRLDVLGMPTDTINGKQVPYRIVMCYPVSKGRYSVFLSRDDGSVWGRPQQTIPGESPPGFTLVEETFPPGAPPPTGTAFILR